MRTVQRSTAKLSKAKQAQFLSILTETLNIAEACRRTGVTRQNAYRRKQGDPDFSKAWDDALSAAVDRAELELLRRGVEGYSKPVFYKGDVVGYTREYSDACLLFALKSHKPEKYRDQLDVNVSATDSLSERLAAARRRLKSEAVTIEARSEGEGRAKSEGEGSRAGRGSRKAGT